MNHSLIQTLLSLSLFPNTDKKKTAQLLPHAYIQPKSLICLFSIGYMFSKMERSPEDINSDELGSRCVYLNVDCMCKQVCDFLVCVHSCLHEFASVSKNWRRRLWASVPECVLPSLCVLLSVCACVYVSFCSVHKLYSVQKGEIEMTHGQTDRAEIGSVSPEVAIFCLTSPLRSSHQINCLACSAQL